MKNLNILLNNEIERMPIALTEFFEFHGQSNVTRNEKELRTLKNFTDNLKIAFSSELERLERSLVGDVVSESIEIKARFNDITINVSFWSVSDGVITKNQLIKVNSGWNRKAHFRLQNRVVKTYPKK